LTSANLLTPFAAILRKDADGLGVVVFSH